MAIPITVDTGLKSVYGPRYMRAIASLAPDGKLQVRTQTESHMDAAGFTGGVFVLLMNKDDQVLFMSPLLQYGVDGRYVFWSKSSRWDDAYFQVDPAVIADVNSIKVWLGWAGKNRLIEIYNQIAPWVGLPQIPNKPKLSDVEALINKYFTSGKGVLPTLGAYQSGLRVAKTLLASVEPSQIRYGVPTQVTVTAKDSKTDVAVKGRVFVSQSLPVSRAGALLGETGQPVSVTIGGHYHVEMKRERGERLPEPTWVFTGDRLIVEVDGYDYVAYPSFTLLNRPPEPKEDPSTVANGGRQLVNVVPF